MRRRLLSVLLLAPLAGACEDPMAWIDMVEARATRDPSGRVVVDVDLLARQGLGDNIGVYCLRVDFPDQKLPAQECKADLRDGDTKTARFVSEAVVRKDAVMTVWLWWAEDHKYKRDVVAPP